MQPDLSGNLSLAPSSLPGGGGVTASVDVENSLGLVDPSTSFHGRAELDAGPIRVSASGFRYSQSGNGRLTASFGDLSAGADVATNLDITNLKAAVTFDLIDTGVFRLSPGIGVDVFLLDGRITESVTASFEDVDDMLPVPMLFAQAEVDLGPVSGVIDAGFLDYETDEVGGRFLDIEAFVAFSPASHIELLAGYRYIDIDAFGESEGQELTANLTLQGWFIGGGISF